MTRSTIVLIVMLALGSHGLLTGLRYRLGSYKAPYFARPTQQMYAELGVSAGILFLILALSSLLMRDRVLSEGVVTAVTLLTYLAIAALALNWLLNLSGSKLWQPAWVIWLESHYTQQQIEQLSQKAQEAGLRQWEMQVATQTDLEEWITAVLSPKVKPQQHRKRPPTATER